MKNIKVEEKNTKRFKNAIQEIIVTKGDIVDLRVSLDSKYYKSGLAWNFNSKKEIKDSFGKKDGIICRYLCLNTGLVKNSKLLGFCKT